MLIVFIIIISGLGLAINQHFNKNKNLFYSFSELFHLDVLPQTLYNNKTKKLTTKNPRTCFNFHQCHQDCQEGHQDQRHGVREEEPEKQIHANV